MIDQIVARSVAMYSLKSFGDRNSDRDVLTEGASHDVKLRASGSVDGQRVSLPIKGSLSVGLGNPSGYTSRPDLLRLLAHAVELMPKTKRNLFFQTVREPDVSDETQKLVKALIQSLSIKKHSSGSVRFIEHGKKG